MKKELTVSAYEVLSAIIAMLLMTALVGYLYHQLSVSRANEREMSKRYYEVIRNGGPR